MKPFNVVVIGEPVYIKTLINCIGYGPDGVIKHKYKVSGSEITKEVKMNFGSLQVDEDHRIDFFGGNDEALFEFVEGRPEKDFKGMIFLLDADDLKTLSNFENKIKKHKSYLERHALVVGVSGSDYTLIKQVEEQVRNHLSTQGTPAPVFSIDPDDKEEVSLLVESLLCFARPGISDSKSGKSSFTVREKQC